jgi:hypothetical protein
VDLFGRRIIEVDIAGNEVTAVLTALLGDGDGRGLAIDSDVSTQRIFLQVNNEGMYVLSSELIGYVRSSLRYPSCRSVPHDPGSCLVTTS